MPSILVTVLVLAALVGAAVGLLLLYIFISHRLWTRQTFRQMGRAGRLLLRTQFEQYLAAGAGTVLFEAPTLGWRVLRVWWTPDNVLSLGREGCLSDHSPDAEEIEPSPLECWCYDTYVASGTGRASLVPIGIFGGAWQRFPESIKKRFPNCRTVFVRSAVIELFRTHCGGDD